MGLGQGNIACRLIPSYNEYRPCDWPSFSLLLHFQFKRERSFGWMGSDEWTMVQLAWIDEIDGIEGIHNPIGSRSDYTAGSVGDLINHEAHV